MIHSWWAAEKSNSEPVPGLAEAILVFGIWVPLLGADEKSEVLQWVHRMTMYIRVYIYTYFICNVAGILLCLSSSLLLRLQYNMFICIVSHHHHHPSSIIHHPSSIIHHPSSSPIIHHPSSITIHHPSSSPIIIIHHHHPSSIIPQPSSSSSSPSLSSWWLFSDMIGCWWPHVVTVDLRSNLTMTILKSRFMVKQVGFLYGL